MDWYQSHLLHQRKHYVAIAAVSRPDQFFNISRSSGSQLNKTGQNVHTGSIIKTVSKQPSLKFLTYNNTPRKRGVIFSHVIMLQETHCERLLPTKTVAVTVISQQRPETLLCLMLQEKHCKLSLSLLELLLSLSIPSRSQRHLLFVMLQNKKSTMNCQNCCCHFQKCCCHCQKYCCHCNFPAS